MQNALYQSLSCGKEKDTWLFEMKLNVNQNEAILAVMHWLCMSVF